MKKGRVGEIGNLIDVMLTAVHTCLRYKKIKSVLVIIDNSEFYFILSTIIIRYKVTYQTNPVTPTVIFRYDLYKR